MSRRRRRYSRSQVAAALMVGLVIGTQLHHCNQFTPHERPGAMKPDRALVSTQEKR